MTPFENEKAAKRLERKQAAYAAQPYILEVAEDRSKAIVDRMVSVYRSGEASHAALVGLLAELSAVRAFVTQVQRDIKE